MLTRMTKSISSKRQKIMDENRNKDIKRAFVKNQESRNLYHTFLNFVILFIFCSRTDRPTDKVNYILAAHWFRESSQISI